MKKGWFLILVLVLLVYGCSNVSEEKPVLNELQTTACESASSNNNCDRLADLGLVSANDCCNALDKCCGDDVTGRAVQNTLSNTSVDEFKSVLIQAIKSYFSNSPVLTTVELKDLIWTYFAAQGNTVNLDVTGKYSGKKLIDVYNKVKVCVPATCSSLGKQCGLWSDGCGGTLNCGACTSGQCVDGKCLADETKDHKGCYNNDIYWLDISNKPVELIQECNVDCSGWAVNSICHERNDGRVEVLMYPECFETYCQNVSGGPYCESRRNFFPIGVENIENRKAKWYIFTINNTYKDNPSYWYIGEPTSPILAEDMVEGRGMPKYIYINPDHPKIINSIPMSGVYWDEKGVLVRSSSDTLAKPPCRILTDLIPFYEENNIAPKPSSACDKNECVCNNTCSQAFTDSFYYTHKKFVFARCT